MNIKDYLHLYMGSLAEVSFMATTGTHTMTTTITPHALEQKHWRIKPLLRPLSDMTEQEEEEWLSGREETRTAFQGRFVENDWATHSGFCDGGGTLYLLSKGFDLFGLIDAGLALDKTQEVVNGK